jgi:hypothetical protein
MKWREAKRKTSIGYTQPSAVRYVARGGGKSYEVSEAWVDRIARRGATVWWSYDGYGHNRPWATKEQAQAWCERDVSRRPETPQ